MTRMFPLVGCQVGRCNFVLFVLAIFAGLPAHAQDWSQPWTNRCLNFDFATRSITNLCPPPAPRFWTAMAELPDNGGPGHPTIFPSGVAMLDGYECPTAAPCGPTNTILGNDFWVWQGSQNGGWINVTSQYPYRPTPRAGATMALDRSRNEIVLFGGYGIAPGTKVTAYLDDTWVFDFVHGWQGPFYPSPRPEPRYDAAMSFNETGTLQRVILVNGSAPAETQAGGFAWDTWEWIGDSKTWKFDFIIDQPAGRGGARMATVPSIGTILFGGFPRWMAPQ